MSLNQVSSIVGSDHSSDCKLCWLYKNLYPSRVLSALAVVVVAVYRQHKVPLFAGTPYATADPRSAFD